MKNIVMIMPYHRYLTAAKSEGMRIHAIWDRAVAERIFGAGAPADAYLATAAELADGFALTDFNDEAALSAAIRTAVADFDADVVYHVGQEESMLGPSRLAEELGLAANPASSIAVLNDKFALREMLAKHDVSPVRFAHATHWRDVGELLDEVELPVVVKPTDLSGSRGVLLLEDRAQFDEWGALLTSYDYDGPVLVEEYLTGPEFSVETVSVRGRHHVIGVTRKLLGAPPLFVEAGHVHPEPEGDSTAQLGALTVTMLELSGYQTGPAHTEIRMTPAGPRIIESQARLAGDKIPRLVHLATGLDLERAVLAALAGRPPTPSDPGAGAARIGYFQLPTGVIETIGGLTEIRALPYVSELSMPFAVGDTVPETVDWRTRHGFVVVSGTSVAQTAARLAEVEDLLDVRVSSAAESGESSDIAEVVA